MSTTLSEAVTLLKCLREAVTGARYADKYIRKYEERLAWQTVLADNISKYVLALDLFLTDSSEDRELAKDMGDTLKAILGMGEWVFLLSDGETTATLRLPTSSNPQVFTLEFPNHPANAKAYTRWKMIDIPASQPTEFGLPDEDGNEIRP